MAPALAHAQARPLPLHSERGPFNDRSDLDHRSGCGNPGMVFDTLYGLDATGQSRHPVCAGHDVSADGLTWTFTLRDGLTFHDGERVLAKDCAMSVRRWGSRDSFGQPLLAATSDIETIDDRRFRIRLKRPFNQMLYGLAARGCFMMPERMAKTPGTEQIEEAVGSGPFRFLPDQWVSGVSAAYAQFDGYDASAGTAELPGGRLRR